MQKQYYGAVYITTNLITSKRYIGKVVFARINDWEKYLGSGLYLKRAVKKYGKENFKKELIILAETEEELRLEEEEAILATRAVESENYYNLKYTSIGGDTFTHNPRKEEIRILKSKRSSGKNNPMYGKPKSVRMIESVKLSNSKACFCGGIYFTSRTHAATILNMKVNTVSFRISSKTFTNWTNFETNKCLTTIEST